MSLRTATRTTSQLVSRRCATTPPRLAARRWQSTQSQPSPAPQATNAQGAFWTTGRVLLFAAFTGSLTYLYGIKDSSSYSKLSPAKLEAPKKPSYADKATLEKAIKGIQEQLGEDSITTDDEELHRHGYSEWSSINIEQLPVAVAYPKNTNEVSQIVKFCHKYKIPIIPYSGGSSLEANFSAPYGGVSVDFAFMDKVLELRPDDMDVTVQPALGWMALNEKIKDSGLFFPVDPGPSAMIGGMIGTSCSGTNAVRYGTMKDWVVNLTVVLADGTVIKTRKRPRKTAAGYNLTGLFIGSEGTLGLVTEATLKLAVIPQETSVAVANFPTIRDAAATASKVLRTGVPVAAMEVMDEVQMSVINRAGASAKKWVESPTLFFKFSGTPSAVKEHIAQVRGISKEFHGGDFEFAKSEEEGKALWSARKESLWSMLALKRDGDEVWSTDVAVPISRLPDIIEVSKKEMDDLGLFASILGHIGDGNFHESIMYNAKNPEERKKVEECVYRMVDRALEMEGTCTGEHGIGIGKKTSLVKELGLDTIGIMHKIKSALDPDWIVNPGKIFDPPT
ncbi:D-lactate dehydrogenase mitochondrial precursor [Polychaeton citri CBS 116435]|uniref:D-lactate dehydrogenase (cytochrome) n=1 Tax=Polychaeton citri CBS 116435 TaxID=1314669 RepID=A0A9P4QE05_9PEZI|nr:D-lactate dehydrogenase mitochondrial precursor [Polychaeton citri CBS 116435]